MRLKQGFITHTLQGTQMMVAAGAASKQFHGIVRSNETAAFIIDCLKKDTTIESITRELMNVYEVSEDIAQRDINMVIEKLTSIGAIE